MRINEDEKSRNSQLNGTKGKSWVSEGASAAKRMREVRINTKTDANKEVASARMEEESERIPSLSTCAFLPLFCFRPSSSLVSCGRIQVNSF